MTRATAKTKAVSLSERLAGLGEAVVAATARVRELEVERERVTAEIVRLTDEIVESHASGDTAAAGKLSATRDGLEQGATREADERLEGARRALGRVEVERAAFAVENLPGLLGERRPAAVAAVEAVQAALAGLERARSEWLAVHADVAGLLRLAGANTGDLPQFPERLAVLVRDARRAESESVPSPLPYATGAAVPVDSGTAAAGAGG